MIKTILKSAIALLVCLIVNEAIAVFPSNNKHIVWPNGAKAAVSLSYDDALNSQLDNAIPQLEQFGFKGSFYLTLSSPIITNRLNEWRKAASNGHELGNHSINHPCRASLKGRDWVSEENDLDQQSIAQYKQELLNANAWLHSIDNQTIRTLTLPCGDHLVAGKSILPEVEDYFVGIKTAMSAQPDPIATLDIKRANVLAPSDISGDALIAYAKLAEKEGTIANYTFHGIGGDYLTVSAQAHQALLTYLHNNPDIYWVATFREISQHINAQGTKVHKVRKN